MARGDDVGALFVLGDIRTACLDVNMLLNYSTSFLVACVVFGRNVKGSCLLNSQWTRWHELFNLCADLLRLDVSNSTIVCRYLRITKLCIML